MVRNEGKTSPLLSISRGKGHVTKTRARINAGLRLARWELNHKKIIANCFEQDLGSINLPHGSYLLLSPPVVTILHVTFLMSTGTYIKLSWASNHLRIWKQLHGNGVKGAEGVAFISHLLVGSAEGCLVGKTSLRCSERTHITPDNGERIECATNSTRVSSILSDLFKSPSRQMFVPPFLLLVN